MQRRWLAFVVFVVQLSPVAPSAQDKGPGAAPCRVGDRFVAQDLEGAVRSVWPDHIKVRPDGAEPYDLVTVPLPFGRAPYVWPTPAPAYGTSKPTPKPSKPAAAPDAAAKCVPGPTVTETTLVDNIPRRQLTAGPGILPLNSELLQTALTASSEQVAYASSPVLAKLPGLSLIEAKNLNEDAPFSILIRSPWVRAASAAAEARRKYQPVPQFSVDELNQQGLFIEVSAGPSFVTADAIENVVLKRGDEIIRPIASDVEPETIENRMGAKRQVSRGRFKFAMDALNPSSALTIVCIGSRGNFELALTPLELSQLR